MATLDVYCFGELAGELEEEAGDLRFSYGAGWLAAGRPPLSQSLPLGQEHRRGAAQAFFAGLLPEGEPRRLLARRLSISAGNDFALLAALGWDCAGAVSLYPHVVVPVPDAHGEDVVWLDEAELAEEIRELPDRPMHADPDGEVRLSLAGAQDKLPVIVGADGRVGITSARPVPEGAGRTPSTHILKAPIARLQETVVNEAYCLTLGRLLGIATVEAEPRRAGDAECLLVRRYDRQTLEDGGVLRLHQEDFCQALGVSPERKYESEGGPSLADCFALVDRAVGVPARETPKLLDAVGLSFLVANHDSHAKNLSLLYSLDGTQLAPLYDVVSTFVYRRTDRLMSSKMAMKIGGEYRADYVQRRHLDRLFDEAGLGAAVARRRLRELAQAAPDAARAARAELAPEFQAAAILDDVAALVEQRARRLRELTMPAPRKPRAGR